MRPPRSPRHDSADGSLRKKAVCHARSIARRADRARLALRPGRRRTARDLSYPYRRWRCVLAAIDIRCREPYSAPLVHQRVAHDGKKSVEARAQTMLSAYAAWMNAASEADWSSSGQRWRRRPALLCRTAQAVHPAADTAMAWRMKTHGAGSAGDEATRTGVRADRRASPGMESRRWTAVSWSDAFAATRVCPGCVETQGGRRQCCQGVSDSVELIPYELMRRQIGL